MFLIFFIGLGNYTIRSELSYAALDIDDIQLLPSMSLDEIGSIVTLKRKEPAIQQVLEDTNAHEEEHVEVNVSVGDEANQKCNVMPMQDSVQCHRSRE